MANLCDVASQALAISAFSLMCLTSVDYYYNFYFVATATVAICNKEWRFIGHFTLQGNIEVL